MLTICDHRGPNPKGPLRRAFFVVLFAFALYSNVGYGDEFVLDIIPPYKYAAEDFVGKNIKKALKPMLPPSRKQFLAQSAAVRFGLGLSLREWMIVEMGLYVLQEGAIADSTAMFQYGQRSFVEGGLGLSYASGINFDGVNQSSRWNFRDVLGIGYHFNNPWSLGMRLVHYSNGRKFNPLFGTTQNDGYTWFALHAVKEI